MRQRTDQILVFVFLVAATVGARLYFEEIPNFAPVAAVALFAGFFFRSRWLALLVPLSVMAISDYFAGRYHPLLMVTVYSFLALPALLGGPLRRFVSKSGGTVAAGASLVCCSLASSLLFFAATNLMTWVVTPWYPRTLNGLIDCYVAAIPFFRYTLAGDMFFAAVLFGSYAVMHQLSARRAARVSYAQGS